MAEGSTGSDRAQSAPMPASTRFSAPQIALPKGGGAIRGIDEKFGANPATGTGSLSIPIAASPGRSGFGQARGELRFRRRQRNLRDGLEPVAAVDHPPDRQGTAAV